MNRYLIVGAIFSVLLIVVLALFQQLEVDVPEELEPEQMAVSDIEAKTNRNETEVTEKYLPISERPQQVRVAGDDPSQDEEEIERVILEELMELPENQRLQQIVEGSNRPVDFHALILDQYGNPVPDVKIDYKVTKEIMFGYDPRGGQTVSDQEGRFRIAGAGSHFATVGLEKKGYAFEFDGRANFSNRPRTVAESDPVQYSYEKPRVFPAWKAAIDEPMRKGTVGEKLILEDIYYVDLAAHADNAISKKNGPADFTVRLFRTPSELPKVGVRPKSFDWRYEIEVMGGGLIENKTEFSFLAPESGYVPKVIIQRARDDANWVNRNVSKWYLRSRNGKVHAAINMILHPSKGRFAVNFVLNPNSSRNLQYSKTADNYCLKCDPKGLYGQLEGFE